MGEDARGRLVAAAHRTLGGAGVRYTRTVWTDPPPPGVTDADLRVEGEVDLAGGRARTRTSFPVGGGCALAWTRAVGRVPLFGARLVREAREEETQTVTTIRDGDRRLVEREGTWRELAPVSDLPASSRGGDEPAVDLQRLLDADAARDEGADEHGTRLRFRCPPTRRRLEGPHVRWGWAWLDADGRVRRVLWTRASLARPRTPLRRRRPAGAVVWHLLELREVDVPVAIEVPPAEP